MKRTRLMAALLAAVAMILTYPAEATAAGARTDRDATRYCVIVVGKAPKGEISPVRSTNCDIDRDAPTLKRAAAGQTLLMTWFSDIYQSGEFTYVYGDYGGCDAEGYKVSTSWYWGNRISSFLSDNYCNVATGYDYKIAGDHQTWSEHQPCACLTVDWVGSFMNDRIESFWIRKG
jgi:hypothetical protein